MQNPTLVIYAKILDISQRMAAEAKVENWDALTVSERERTNLFAQLPNPVPALPPDEAGQLADMIRHIMSLDAEVRKHVEPWLEQVGRLIPALAPHA